MNPFSAITSKIFAGTSLLALAACGFIYLEMHAKLGEVRRQLDNMEADNAVLRVNSMTLKENYATAEDGLAKCNASVDAAAAVAQKLSAAGAAAVAQIQQAGKDTTARALKRIDAAPKSTCDDALKILKGS